MTMVHPNNHVYIYTGITLTTWHNGALSRARVGKSLLPSPSPGGVCVCGGGGGPRGLLPLDVPVGGGGGGVYLLLQAETENMF